MACTCSTSTAAGTVGDERHPLSSLSRREIERAGRILRAAGVLGDTQRLALLTLDEPDKRALAAGDPPRRAIAHVLDGAAAVEVVVDLGDEIVVATTPIDPLVTGQVPLLSEEHDLIRELIRDDERWAKALSVRGIDDPGTVVLAGLSAGRYEIPGEDGRRLARVLGHHQPHPGAMPWAHPVDGLVAYVDLAAREVVEVIDAYRVPVPAEPGDYHVPGTFGPDRTTQRPIEISQPEGPSFAFDGDALSWEKWSLRLGFDMREGLILHQIGFDDGGRIRPIVHRASIAEMLVPYGDPGPVRFWQNYFDTGEYLLGRLANSLELGCDCLGEIAYLDVAIPDSAGGVRTIKNAVCVHEEDAGVLWKHTEQFTGTTDVRRQRRLVLSFFTTVGNYDYGFYWYLYLDGRIEFEAKATGIVFTAAFDERTARYASELAPGLAAPYHQHLFCARLDMAVDGPDNAVDEVDVVRIAAGADNPYGNAIGRRVTRLRTEREGRRRADASADRTWRVSNPGVLNRMGAPVSYVLHPEGKPVLLAADESVIARRAAFAGDHLWVTAFDPAERYPAGTLVNQSAPGQGLPVYIAGDASIDGGDIVVWHTFGLTHFPRLEDWPIMPVDTTGFTLVPSGFFDRNPTLDVPPSSPVSGCDCDHVHHHAGHGPEEPR
ncbi:primary-amine oxidase [Jiangella alkaliphila]|uniref:Amine oxidase n=1 Tax=Jiangella alkaliphila TaxID=419479 RepID=A0A1H2LDM3_9ACTN|nr:primary-amine oxidase [Jiangella alkaliphila]SDU78738.1 primary-amine oxidase [Jiangella alkaliphila]